MLTRGITTASCRLAWFESGQPARTWLHRHGGTAGGTSMANQLPRRSTSGNRSAGRPVVMVVMDERVCGDLHRLRLGTVLPPAALQFSGDPRPSPLAVVTVLSAVHPRCPRRAAPGLACVRNPAVRPPPRTPRPPTPGEVKCFPYQRLSSDAVTATEHIMVTGLAVSCWS